MKTEVTKMKGPIGGGDLGTTTPEGSAHANDIQINMRCPGYPRISGNSTNNQLTSYHRPVRLLLSLFV